MINMIFGNLSPQLLIMRLIAVTLALTVHEFCHGYAAYKLGDRTAHGMGRLSLNPAHHIDPIGMILIILFGFGWAKPVMVNPFNLLNPKRDMAIISIAGPLSNFIMAFVTMMIAYPMITLVGGGGIAQMHNMMHFLGRAPTGLWGNIFGFMGVFVIINIVLGVFNLIPIPPLDGSKILALFLPNHLYFRFTNFRYGMHIMMVLIIFGGTSFVIMPALNGIFDVFFRIASALYGLIL